jgi:glycogen synthase
MEERNKACSRAETLQTPEETLKKATLDCKTKLRKSKRETLHQYVSNIVYKKGVNKPHTFFSKLVAHIAKHYATPDRMGPHVYRLVSYSRWMKGWSRSLLRYISTSLASRKKMEATMIEKSRHQLSTCQDKRAANTKNSHLVRP